MMKPDTSDLRATIQQPTLLMFKDLGALGFCGALGCGVTRWYAGPGLEGEDPGGSGGWRKADHSWAVQWAHL